MYSKKKDKIHNDNKIDIAKGRLDYRNCLLK